MSETLDKEELLAELGFGHPQARDRALAVLEAANLTNPRKAGIAAYKRAHVERALSQAREDELEDEEPGRAEPRVSYQQKWIKCGNPDCKCARGEKHGPYWYASWREGGRVRSKYLGKELPR